MSDDVQPPAETDQPTLQKFFDDLATTGTVVKENEEDVAAQVIAIGDSGGWLVSAYRGKPVDPPYLLALDADELADALDHDAHLIEQRWPGGDARARAYDALRQSFDAALDGMHGAPHRFVLDDNELLRVSTDPPCLEPWLHVRHDDSGHFYWSPYEPGTPEFEEELARQPPRSRHRRHAGLVKAWLAAEAAPHPVRDSVWIAPAVTYLHDQVEATFGHRAMVRFGEVVHARSLEPADLAAIAHDGGGRLDELLDVLAGEPRDG